MGWPASSNRSRTHPAQDAPERKLVAGTFGNSDRDRVLDATDLVALVGEHVQLRPKGREHVGLCPFHDDRAPSMTVVTHKGAGFYKCFSCGAAGNAIDFMMNYHKMEFIDALRALAERAGIELRQTRAEDGATGGRRALLRANAIAANFFRKALAHAEHGTAARDALDARGIEDSMRERFQLGAAPAGWDIFVRHLDRLREHRAGVRGDDAVPELDVFRAAGLVRDGRQGPIDGFRNRVIFPICDEMGQPIAFGARQINKEDQPKYLNSPESGVFHKGRGLYGIHLAKKSIIDTRTAVICEGYTDVIACHRAGVTNAVATLGTALTREHARALKRMAERVVLLFDGDAAGQKAADRAIEVFFAEPIDVRICTLPDELDPDELLRQPDGRVRFDAALERSEDALRHFVRRFRQDFQAANGLSAQQQRIEAVLARLVELGFRSMPGLRRTLVMSSLSSITGLAERELEAALEAVKAPASRPAPDEATEVRAAPTRRPTLEEQGFGAPQARARREAERGVLAIVLAHPAAATGHVRLDDGSSLPFTEAITPESFLDPECRAVFEPAHVWLEDRHAFTAEELLAELRWAPAKSAAVDLVMLGERRTPSENEAPQRLQEAVDAFERIRRAQLSVLLPSHDAPHGVTSHSISRTSDEPDALAARLEAIRHRGRDPTAFGRLPGRAGQRAANSPPE
jgi:DNA primase